VRRILALAVPVLLAFMTQLAPSTPTAPGKGMLSREQLHEDFQILRQALEEGHPGLYRYTPKAEMDAIFERAARSLAQPMNTYAFYRVVAPVIAAIKCGHTEVHLPTALREQLQGRTSLLPLQVKVLDRKPYVLRDLATPDRRLAGREILSINGVPAAEIVARMLAATPGDGDVVTSRQLAISSWQFAENLVTLLDLHSPYEVALAARGTAQPETVRLAGRGLPELRAAAGAQGLQQPAQSPELAFFDQGRTAVMRFREFNGLHGFFRDSFQELAAKKTAALILDLRNNGGGYDDLGKLLLSYLIDQPFQYYSDLVMNKVSFDFEKYAADAGPLPAWMKIQRGKDGRYHLFGHPNWGLQQPSLPTFRGKVFILINGGSFSTTAEFLSQAHFHRRATFIGEESGGGYYGDNGGFMPTLILPRSQLRVIVPLVAYYVAVSGNNAPTHGIIPDRPVHYTIEDVLAGKDLEMELALTLARQP
jgi:peptidase S41-like protein